MSIEADHKLHERNRLGKLVCNAEEVRDVPLSTRELVEAKIHSIDDQIKYLQARLDELGGPQLQGAWFCFDDGPAFRGYHDGTTWNGWACPCFTKEIADHIIEFFNKTNEGPPSRFVPEYDGYMLGWEQEDEPYIYKKNSAGLYELGSGSLCWNLIIHPDEGQEAFTMTEASLYGVHPPEEEEPGDPEETMA